MIQSKAGMLIVLMILSVHSTSHASMGDKTRLRGFQLQPDVSYQLQSRNAVLDGVDCVSGGGRSAPRINAFGPHVSDITAGWSVSAGIAPPAISLAADTQSLQRFLLPPHESSQPNVGNNIAVAESRDSDSGVMAATARNFHRIEVLQYAQAWITEVIPDIEIPAHARTAAMTLEARHLSFMLLGLNAQAEEYRQPEPADQTQPASEILYLSPCIDASKRRVAKAIVEFRAMYQAAG